MLVVAPESLIHVENEHVNDQLNPWVCDQDECDHPAFPSLQLLAKHVRKRTREKQLHFCSWPECDKQYTREENLKIHFRVHTGDKPYTCKFVTCRKTFSNASDCSKHQKRVHSDLRSYVCRYPECTKRYTDPSSLRKHVKYHHSDFVQNGLAHV